MLKIMMMLVVMSHLTGSAVLDQGPDHHSFTGVLLCQAEAKTCVILRGHWDNNQQLVKQTANIFKMTWESHYIFYCVLLLSLKRFARAVKICAAGGLTMVNAKIYWRYCTWGRMMCWMSLDNPPRSAESVSEPTVSSHSVVDPCAVWPRAALFLVKQNQIWCYPWAGHLTLTSCFVKVWEKCKCHQ